MSNSMRLFVVGAAVAMALSCAGRKHTWEAKEAKDVKEATEEEVVTAKSLVEEGDELWLDRSSRESLEKALEKWHAAVESNPKDYETFVKLSHGYYFLSDAHIRFEGTEKDMMETYQKGVDMAEMALVILSPEFKEKVKTGTNVEKAVEVIGIEGAPAMYWFSTNLGKFAVLKGFSTIVFWKDTVKAVMQRVLDLDETFYYAAPHRYFGAFYAKAPAFAGGDIEKSKIHFDKAMELSPEYLSTKVLYAEFYATKSQDRDLYEKALKEVIEADISGNEDILPENKAEQRKAQKLLDEIDENF